MAEPLRIAVIGAGLIGRKHIARILEHPDFDLAGIAEIDREAVAARYPGVPVETDFRVLLDRTRPDAVLIASPNALHAAQGIECARRGLPFLVEKPVTDTLESALALIDAVRKSGVATLVGHHRRHHPPVQKARDLVGSGAIGALVGISGIWATCKPASYFEAGPWRREKGGGVILINLIHEIDFMRFVAGEITGICAMTANRQRGFPVEDTAALVLEFASGALGSFLLADCAPTPWTMEQGLGESPEFPFSGENDYRFIGTTGALEFPSLQHWSQAGEAGDWTMPMLRRSHFAGRLDPYTAQLTHFADVLRGALPSLQPVDDGALTLVAAAVVSEAAERGCRIDIRARSAAITGG